MNRFHTKQGLFGNVRSIKGSRAESFSKKKFQDLHVGSLLGRLHGLLQNTADTETVDTTEDIGSGHSVTDTLALPKTHGTPWEGQDTTLGGVCRLTHVLSYSL